MKESAEITVSIANDKATKQAATQETMGLEDLD
jgi:hypothetical protein